MRQRQNSKQNEVKNLKFQEEHKYKFFILEFTSKSENIEKFPSPSVPICLNIRILQLFQLKNPHIEKLLFQIFQA